MSINISNSVRSSNPYLAEVDKVQKEVSAIDTRVSTLEGGGGGFSSYTISLNGSGASNINNIEFTLQKFGNFVTISRTSNLDFTVASGVSVLTFTAIPVEFRPSNSFHFLVLGNPNAVQSSESVLSVIILSTGVITVNNISSSRFFNLGNSVRVYPFSVSYITN